MFRFKGAVPASKSWLNRALVIQHFNPGFKFDSDCDSEDVIFLRRALSDLAGGKNIFDLGMGGTTFRFFSFLVSRYPGTWTLKAHERLLQRPQRQLGELLGQLGVGVEFKKDAIEINSKGWIVKKKVVADGSISSQFLSGLLLSSWNLQEDMHVEIPGKVSSEGYLNLTLELLKIAGMEIRSENGTRFHVASGSKPKTGFIQAEPDVSSAFSLAAAAVVGGQAQITNWNQISLQPDMEFLKVFRKMGITFSEDSTLSVSKQASWSAIEYNIGGCPDLFPVLAGLCAFADGVSYLYGAESLRHKESDRIHQTAKLLHANGFQAEETQDGLKIYGNSSTKEKSAPVEFDPDFDHRMAMAAALFKLKGFNIRILSPEVVKKSYPSFWKDTGLA